MVSGGKSVCVLSFDCHGSSFDWDGKWRSILVDSCESGGWRTAQAVASPRGRGLQRSVIGKGPGRIFCARLQSDRPPRLDSIPVILAGIS